jgi:GT2 family glycosyltransferase
VIKPQDLSIVIPVYGAWDYVKNLLDSLSSEHNIIVVDDDSPEEQPEWLARRCQEQSLKVITNVKNLGFGGSCNRGFEEVKTVLVCFLNSDIVAPTQDWWKPMAQKLRQPNVGAVGPQLRYNNGTIQCVGISFIDGNPYHPGRNALLTSSIVRKSRQVEALTGACLMTYAGLFKELHGFDTKYKVGNYEDVDLSLRLRCMDKELWYVPESVLTHFEAISMGARPENLSWLSDNWKLFRSRWVKDDQIVLPPKGG